MASEVMRELITDPGGTYIDATIGNAGHAERIMEELNDQGRLIGLDRDRDAVIIAQSRLARFGSRATVCHSDYRRLGAVCRELGVRQITGALIDLGLSSLQLDEPTRGFSYQLDGPLDLRFDTSEGTPVSEWLHSANESAIAAVLSEYGEEPHARKIARMIVAERAQAPVETTSRLREIIIRAVGNRVPAPARPSFRTVSVAPGLRAGWCIAACCARRMWRPRAIRAAEPRRCGCSRSWRPHHRGSPGDGWNSHRLSGSRTAVVARGICNRYAVGVATLRGRAGGG
jgi:16S rRNA (cytosine1402-N4)-methyltransferase